MLLACGKDHFTLSSTQQNLSIKIHKVLHTTASVFAAAAVFSRLHARCRVRAVFVVVGVGGINLVQQVLRGYQNCPRLETSVQFRTSFRGEKNADNGDTHTVI